MRPFSDSYPDELLSLYPEIREPFPTRSRGTRAWRIFSRGSPCPGKAMRPTRGRPWPSPPTAWPSPAVLNFYDAAYGYEDFLSMRRSTSPGCVRETDLPGQAVSGVGARLSEQAIMLPERGKEICFAKNMEFHAFVDTPPPSCYNHRESALGARFPRARHFWMEKCF